MDLDYGDGVSRSGHGRDRLFWQSDSGFVDLSAVSGLDHPGDGRAAARLDFDLDGLPDLAVTYANAPRLRLYRNQVPRHGGFVAVRLVGSAVAGEPSRGRTARDACGTRIRLRAGDLVVARERRCGDGFAAQHSATLLLGLGEAEQARDLEILWPSGQSQQLGEVAAGQLVVAHEGGEFEVRPYGAPPEERSPGPPEAP
jgi:hypothetical protein